MQKLRASYICKCMYNVCLYICMYLWLVSTKIEEASTKRTPFFSCQNAVWSAISELLCPILSYQNVTCSLQKLQQKSSLMPKAYIDFIKFQGRGKNVLHISSHLSLISLWSVSICAFANFGQEKRKEMANHYNSSGMRSL